VLIVLTLEDLTALESPIVIAGFAGWNDAGEAASGVVKHLRQTWEARPVGEFDPEDYYDYQVNRPTVSLDEGGSRRLEWPTTRLYVTRPPRSTRDVLLVDGIEPNMRWRAFCRELLDGFEAADSSLVVVLGALLADVPHTRPLPVTGTTSDPDMARALNLEQSRYEGSTGIVGVLQHTVQERGLAGVSYWAAVPHYVAQSPCPKATLALIHRVEDVLDVPVPLGDLPEEVRAWERGVEELTSEDSEVAEYVAQLEAQQQPTEQLPEASGDAIAREFERYLRRREQGD
jgi:predicted ATP-grasp superfamily ATP-dependent carboligase